MCIVCTSWWLHAFLTETVCDLLHNKELFFDLSTQPCWLLRVPSPTARPRMYRPSPACTARPSCRSLPARDSACQDGFGDYKVCGQHVKRMMLSIRSNESRGMKLVAVLHEASSRTVHRGHLGMHTLLPALNGAVVAEKMAMADTKPGFSLSHAMCSVQCVLAA